MRISGLVCLTSHLACQLEPRSMVFEWKNDRRWPYSMAPATTALIDEVTALINAQFHFVVLA